MCSAPTIRHELSKCQTGQYLDARIQTYSHGSNVIASSLRCSRFSRRSRIALPDVDGENDQRWQAHCANDHGHHQDGVVLHSQILSAD